MSHRYDGPALHLFVTNLRVGAILGAATAVLSTLAMYSAIVATVPAIVYHLAPIVLLLGAGFVRYRLSPVAPIRAKSTAAIGASLVAGYVPVAVVGRYVLVTAVAGTIGPGLVPSTAIDVEVLSMAVFLGLCYPLVFGALGALCSHHVEYLRESA